MYMSTILSESQPLQLCSETLGGFPYILAKDKVYIMLSIQRFRSHPSGHLIRRRSLDSSCPFEVQQQENSILSSCHDLGLAKVQRPKRLDFTV